MERRLCTRCGERPVAKQSKTKFRAICWSCHKYKVPPLVPYIPASKGVTTPRIKPLRMPDRFWARVNKTPGLGRDGDCWEWTGGTTRKGYGGCKYGGEQVAHRVSWLLTHGKRSALFVLHHCDNRMCVNPAHLYEGDHEDNTRDMIERARWKGSPNAPVTLTDKQVQMVRLMAKCGWTQRFIAKQMRTGEGIINWVVKKKAYRSVPDYVGCE